MLTATVKFYMKKRKLNQKKLADLAGCSESHLSHMLTGKTQGTVALWNTLLEVLKVPGFQGNSTR
jgi:transcriptional regulator with XRE-family HTH domain